MNDKEDAEFDELLKWWCNLSPDQRKKMGGIDTIEADPKVGRNEPCPCGSGKKFKKCCGVAQ